MLATQQSMLSTPHCVVRLDSSVPQTPQTTVSTSLFFSNFTDHVNVPCVYLLFFFFNDPATPEIYPLPLHDALPISVHIGPVKTRVGRARTQLIGLEQCRNRGGNARQYRFRRTADSFNLGPLSLDRSGLAARRQPLLFFFRLKSFPVAQNVGRSLSFHVSEDMRMPIHQLIGKPIQHLIDRKRAPLLRHLGIEEDLEQKVTQLAAQLFPVAIIDGF